MTKNESITKRIMVLYENMLMLDPNVEYDTGAGAEGIITIAYTIARLKTIIHPKRGEQLCAEIEKVEDQYRNLMSYRVEKQPTAQKTEYLKMQHITKVNTGLKEDIVDVLNKHFREANLYE